MNSYLARNNLTQKAKQGKVKFAGWGKSIVPAMEDAGLSIDIQGPTPEAPSVARAIELYLQQNK